MSTQKNYYIEFDNLREKYRVYEGRLKSYSKAIADCSGVKVEVEVKRNKTVQFVVIGGSKGVAKALELIQEKFEISKVYSKTPVAAAFVSENNQRKLVKHSVQSGVPLLTKEALHRHDILTGATELRQFSCKPCDHSWWGFVLRTKPVATCRKCHVRYDALERSREFGVGRFICIECNHNFYAWCTAIDKLECFKCNQFAGPPYINPRFKPFKTISSRPGIKYKVKVKNYSTPHDSTGSTEATFLTQDLGSDIFVKIHDYFYEVLKPETISHLSTSEESSGSDSDTSDEGDDDMDSTAGEVGDFEQDSGDELSEPDETEPNTSCDSRKRREASDSDSSDDEGKGSVKSSEDSGIGTLSNTGTESDIDAGNLAALLSNCIFYPEFPGVAFSKTANEGTLTSLGGEISGTGIQLTIPQGAIPSGDSIDISLKTCIGGPFYLPKGYKFVSPVFLAQPPFAFHKEVILKMEIFAELEENELVFVTSSSKPEIVDDKAEWKFERTTTKPKFCDEKKSGMVDVKHFCFFSLGGRSTAEVKYWSLYYPPKYFNSSCLCHVIFSVSIASKVYRENLERFIREQYKDGDFDRDLQSITFSSDSVTITVGDVQLKEYLVCPLSHPCKIFKKDLQVYKRKKTAKDYAAYPPRIVLKIVQEPTATSTFMHTLEVDGIPTIKTFHILIQPSSDMRPQQLRQVSSGSEASGSSSASLLQDSAISRSSESGQEDGSSSKSRCTEPVIPTMKDLMKYLHPIAPKWKMLGVNLELEMGTIRTIGKDHDSAEDCLLEMLSRWEDAVNPELHNWETIFKAVTEPSLGATNVADLPVWNIQIREMKYLYHIRYYDPNTFEKKELRILEDLSADWQEIGDILGFRPPEMKAIEAKKTPIREIFIKWIQNADMTDRRFPINWTGVYNILEATKHGTTSNDLKDAIETSCSDLHENFAKGVGTRTVSDNPLPIRSQEQQHPSQHMFHQTTSQGGTGQAMQGCTERVTIKELKKHLCPKASQWKTLGQHLGLDTETINTIETDCDSPEDCLLEVLNKWIDCTAPELCNWYSISKAVQELGDSNLAHRIKVKFLS